MGGSGDGTYTFVLDYSQFVFLLLGPIQQLAPVCEDGGVGGVVKESLQYRYPRQSCEVGGVLQGKHSLGVFGPASLVVEEGADPVTSLSMLATDFLSSAQVEVMSS